MTTVTQIITDAYRQSNLVAVGGTPTDAEQTEGLRYLNRLVKSVFGHEVGESFRAIPVGRENISRPSGYPGYDTTPDNEWIVPKNVRLVLNLDESISLYLHPAPDAGTRFAITDIAQSLTANPVTVYGNGNAIEGATSVSLATNGLATEWFYREDLGNWTKYSSLVGADTFPFPEEFDDFFITMLAIRLNPSYGATIDGQSKLILERASRQLKSRYTQNIPLAVEIGLIRMSRMTADMDQWRQMDWLEPNSVFNRGSPW